MDDQIVTNPKEAARGRRRRAASKIRLALKRFDADRITQLQFQGVILSIPTEALDLIMEYARTHPGKLVDIAEAVGDYSTCQDCKQVVTPSEAIFVLYANGCLDVFCPYCYGNKRHVLYT